MLRNRLAENPRAAARVSHAIRSATAENNWFEIDSTKVERLVSAPLPSAEKQLENLINWLKRSVGEEQLAPIQLLELPVLSAIVGTSEIETIEQLFRWAEKEGLVERSEDRKKVSLTPKAWTAAAQMPHIDTHKIDTHKNEPKAVELGHCPNCGPERRADVVARYEKRGGADHSVVWWIDDHMILECRGCGEVYFKLSHYFSEDEEYDTDPITGEMTTTIDPRVTYWPAPSRRARPNWFGKLGDRVLEQLLEEVYSALDADQRVLAAIGTRTALDRAMVILGAPEASGFANKLEVLEQKAFISGKEKEDLLALTDAGSAAAHRGWRPEVGELDTILDGTEAFLHRALVLGGAIRAMQANVPPKALTPKFSKAKK